MGIVHLYVPSPVDGARLSRKFLALQPALASSVSVGRIQRGLLAIRGTPPIGTRVVAAIGLLIVALTGCSSADESVSHTHADRLKAWRTQAQPSMDKMNDALVWFQGAVKSSDFTGALNACRSFAGGVDSLERQLPTPDDGVTAVLREAVTNFRDFGRECLTVNPEMTQDQANAVVSHRNKGIERIKTAVDMMDRIEQQ